MVKDANDSVQILFIDGDTGEAAFDEALYDFCARRPNLNGMDLGSRHHDRLHRSINKIKDAVDELLFRLVEDSLRRTLPDQGLYLLLGYEGGCTGVLSPKKTEDGVA